MADPFLLPASATDAALLLRARGLALWRPDPGTKTPAHSGWSGSPLEPADFALGDSVGVVAGHLSAPPGHALVLVDPNAADAVRRADAPCRRPGWSTAAQASRGRTGTTLVPTATIPAWAESRAPAAAAVPLRNLPSRSATYCSPRPCRPPEHWGSASVELTGAAPGGPAEVVRRAIPGKQPHELGVPGRIQRG